MVARYRAVLSAPGCARLYLTALAGRLPQGMCSLAVLLLVRGHTGSYAAAGIAVGAQALATAVFAPVQGRLVDAFGRRPVLGPAAIGQALALVALVICADAGLGAVGLIILAAVAGALQPSIAPAVRALLREILTDPEVRESAYALESVIQELIWITGPLLVGIVVAFASPAVAVVLSGVVGVSGSLLFLSSPRVAGRGRRDAGGTRASVLGNEDLRALLGPIALTGMAIGAIDVGLPSLALHDGSRAASGLLLALWSAGSMIGGLWYGGRTWRASLRSRYQALLLAGVLCTAPLVAARTIPMGLVGSLLAGLTVAPVFSCQNALIGRAVTAGTETEAFTWVAAALISGLAVGSAVGGSMVGAVGVSAPFILACAALGLAALSAVRLAWRAARQPA